MVVRHNEIKKLAQNRGLCNYVHCKKTGRVLYRLGGVPVFYCGRHRQYGARIMNFFIDSITRFRLSNYLQEKKTKIFLEGYPCLCDACNQKLSVFVQQGIDKIEELKLYEDQRFTDEEMEELPETEGDEEPI